MRLLIFSEKGKSDYSEEVCEGDGMDRKGQAYEYLKKGILENRFSQDQPISEVAVSTELKMSRTPIREALRQLETEGLVVSYPGRGAFVVSLSTDDIEDIYSLRLMMETFALEKSFALITSEEISEVEQCFNSARDTTDWESQHKADRMLHDMIVRKAGSKRLIIFVDMLNVQVERVRRISETEERRSQKSYEEHMKILKYMREKNLPMCKEALREHLRSVSDSAREAARLEALYGKKK